LFGRVPHNGLSLETLFVERLLRVGIKLVLDVVLLAS
jgi:hypothetical protein